MSAFLQRVQNVLDFKGCENPQFAAENGLGRVGLSAYLLGLIGGYHACLVVNEVAEILWGVQDTGPSLQLRWNIYVVSLTWFHFGEFFMTVMFKPGIVSYNSFVLNHSMAYTAAQLCCVAEFWLEALVAPQMKLLNVLMFSGVILSLAGLLLRMLAMWTCGSNFNHIIMATRDEGHELVTNGVYSILRHPSYTGWFWWTVGGQLLLCNPICFIGFYAASIIFFTGRIEYEEKLLRSFYPDTYPAYIGRTHLGIPFLAIFMSRTRRVSHDL